MLNFITVSSEVLSGKPVFKGTRVPVETLFEYIENGNSINEFYADYPGVEKEFVKQALKFAENMFSLKNSSIIEKIDENSFR
jgi:uncharacterized protein (DUF433 family)